MRALSLAVAIAGLFAANASAAVLFSTLGQSNNAPNGIFDTDYRLASDFETQGVGASITGLTLNLNNSDTVGHNFTVSLYSDAGGTVGSLLTNFSSELIAANTFGAVNKLFTGSYSLMANTKYWVVLEMLENVVSSGDQPNWSGNSGDGIDGGGSFLEVASTFAQTSSDGGASWSDASADNFLFNVIGVAAVPEPSRVVLAIAGFFVVGFRRRR
ncbi:MAG: hypothetical protein IPK22_08030 [Verrucomicrobiaceae bacterium]|nr:hypothetical protein [Verrucomicrobiaceae bacterium]